MAEFIPSRATGLKWSPFTRSGPVGRPPLLQRLFRVARPDLARAELERVLAATGPRNLDQYVVSRILDAYHVKGQRAHDILLGLYKQALDRYLVDHEISDQEHSYLVELQKLFELSDADVHAAEAELIHPRFQRAVAEVIADEKVTAEERAALARIGDGLHLSPALQRQLFHDSADALLKQVLRQALADGKLAPEEMETIRRVAIQLGVN